MNKNILVAFSGGRTSAMMAYLMRNDAYYKQQNLVHVFSNTGKEREETLDFVDKCDREFGLNVVWVEACVNPEHGEGTSFKIVDYATASRNGEPFEAVLAKYGISNPAFPHCTRELKNRPIDAYAKSIFGKNWITALGMRFDEIRRASLQNPKRVYPMIEWRMTVRDVREFWKKQPFDLALRDYQGNCDLCWKKSLRKKLTILKENPGSAFWWAEMEKKYGHIRPPGREDSYSKGGFVFNRGEMSIETLVAMSQKPFVSVTDPYLQKTERTDLFDFEQSCSCSNSEFQES